MIVVLGDIAVDIVSRLAAPLVRGSDAPAEVRLMPGGSGANVAVWLARLGQEVVFVGRVGTDAFGRWLEEDLRREGVTPALTRDPARGTGVIQVLVEPDGERTMVPDRGANACWAESDVPAGLIERARLLHIVGYVLLDAASRRGALAAMARARAAGVPISLDPSSHAPLLALTPGGFWTLVGRVDVLLPNRQEAQTLTGAADPGAALSALQAQAQVVAIKLDRDGCVAGDGQRIYRAAAPPIQVVNATGAGDAFNAAFLARWLADGDIAGACRAAVALGAHAATLASTR
ncbi:MAG: carbohydrate kinase family protein [Anaerolineae bacterium]|nr:carbohydrate kinase family protein [Anaerolineae bacterium]